MCVLSCINRKQSRGSSLADPRCQQNGLFAPAADVCNHRIQLVCHASVWHKHTHILLHKPWETGGCDGLQRWLIACCQPTKDNFVSHHDRGYSMFLIDNAVRSLIKSFMLDLACKMFHRVLYCCHIAVYHNDPIMKNNIFFQVISTLTYAAIQRDILNSYLPLANTVLMHSKWLWHW